MQKNSVLGLKIAYYRRLIGLTQEELAERVDGARLNATEAKQVYH